MKKKRMEILSERLSLKVLERIVEVIRGLAFRGEKETIGSVQNGNYQIQRTMQLCRLYSLLRPIP